MRTRSTILLLLTLILTTCASPADTPPPSHTPTLPPVVLPGDGSIFIPAPLDDSPTVENPHLRLIITVTDITTGRPVTATITVDDYTVVSSQVEIIVYGGKHTVAASAPGYQPWSLTIKPQIKRHKKLEMPIRLQPLPAQGDNA